MLFKSHKRSFEMGCNIAQAQPYVNCVGVSEIFKDALKERVVQTEVTK